MGSSPTPIDLAFQVAYKIAHRLLRAYWTVRRPHKGGILIAVWNAGEILIVKNSYRREHTLPGGYPHAGESASMTAARELAEECGVTVRPEDMREIYRGEYLFEGRRDDVTIVEVELAVRPSIKVDHREVSASWFAPPAAVLGLLIVPHLREYLTQRAARPNA